MKSLLIEILNLVPAWLDYFFAMAMTFEELSPHGNWRGKLGIIQVREPNYTYSWVHLEEKFDESCVVEWESDLICWYDTALNFLFFRYLNCYLVQTDCIIMHIRPTGSLRYLFTESINVWIEGEERNRPTPCSHYAAKEQTNMDLLFWNIHDASVKEKLRVMRKWLTYQVRNEFSRKLSTRLHQSPDSFSKWKIHFNLYLLIHQWTLLQSQLSKINGIIFQNNDN